MATTLKEFEAMGVNVNSDDFAYGYSYGMPAMCRRKKAVQKIFEWAKRINKRA